MASSLTQLLGKEFLDLLGYHDQVLGDLFNGVHARVSHKTMMAYPFQGNALIVHVVLFPLRLHVSQKFLSPFVLISSKHQECWEIGPLPLLPKPLVGVASGGLIKAFVWHLDKAVVSNKLGCPGRIRVADKGDPTTINAEVVCIVASK